MVMSKYKRENPYLVQFKSHTGHWVTQRRASTLTSAQAKARIDKKFYDKKNEVQEWRAVKSRVKSKMDAKRKSGNALKPYTMDQLMRM